jgi:hypothetical protein
VKIVEPAHRLVRRSVWRDGGSAEREGECCREQDVLDALVTERWPERVAGELRTHAEDCQICRDLIASVGPILNDRVDLSSEGHLPPSGAMWWRAQKRARQEAVREAARPVTVAHIIGFTCVIAIAAVAVAWLSPMVRTWFVEMSSNLVTDVRMPEIRGTLLSQNWLVLLMAFVWLLLAPLAIYFAVAED